MTRTPRRNFYRTVSAFALTLPAMAAQFACQPEPEGGVAVVSEDPASSATNGLRTINGLRASNGLAMLSGLTSAKSLAASSELMSTASGRLQVSYVVKCALPANRTLVKTDGSSNRHSFTGLLGLAPEWESGSCGQSCQEWVSACLLSLLNASGNQVPIWMMADHPAIGFGQNGQYARQEGAFFGNIFAAKPEAYYCAGRDFSSAPVLGRIGSTLVDPTYTNPYGTGATCRRHCEGSDYPYTGDGYEACSRWNRVVTVWRQ